ncbi:MAG: Asp-tRNA(Asn)/Glu-tRNA(Gln) amidotransferase subunit GatB [Spirochaetales bacterium]|nr:Asp-tRNA(Asn)/Glu-tRNA(Gln) amidotransferase subunit GatB [Spirochaetales bacterium]
MAEYQSFIGLEIHIQLLTATKVFCGCRNRFGDEPNTNVCPVCLGYPGVLPAVNEQALLFSYMVARALNCDLSKTAYFDRKNYFYPDMTKNYQISQFHSPIGRNGWIEYETGGELKKVRIHDVHLEEDAGKSIHRGTATLLDYNRAGTSLLEIVTEPDMETGEDAEAFIQNFRRLVRYLGVCDGNMEEGSLRCDGNISINLKGKGLGTKTEVKNVNSSRFLKLSMNHEIGRQKRALEKGERIVQETRLWNEAQSRTEPMRTKESAHDYRYFPEPDMPPFRPSPAFIADVDARLVELPVYRKRRYEAEYGISGDQVQFLTEEKPVADFFESTVTAGADPLQAAAWICTDIQKNLNKLQIGLEESSLTSLRLAALINLVKEGVINRKKAELTLSLMLEEDKDPDVIVREQGWEQISDSGAIEALVTEVLQANPKAVDQIRGGDMKPMGFLTGQVMKLSKGQADPKLVQAVISGKLGS